MQLAEKLRETYESPKQVEAAALAVLARATTQAALACAHARGRNNRKFADHLAVEAMRDVLNSSLRIGAEVVIGEGERDKAPMLYIGERLGPNQDQPPELLIAVDPLEGTNLCAHWMTGAICVIAGALVNEGHLWGGVDGYMNKFIAGSKVAEGLKKLRSGNQTKDEIATKFSTGYVLDQSVEDTVCMISHFTGKPITSIVAETMDRPRNLELIQRLRAMHVQVRLISDGDVTSAWRALSDRGHVDFYMGIGAAPEGVLSAAMANMSRGYMEGRCWFNDTPEGNQQRERLIAKKIDVNKVHTIEDLAGGHVMVAFTAVTDSMMPEVKYQEGGTTITHTTYGRSRTGTHYEITGYHKEPPLPPAEWPGEDAA